MLCLVFLLCILKPMCVFVSTFVFTIVFAVGIWNTLWRSNSSVKHFSPSESKQRTNVDCGFFVNGGQYTSNSKLSSWHFTWSLLNILFVGWAPFFLQEYMTSLQQLFIFLQFNIYQIFNAVMNHLLVILWLESTSTWANTWVLCELCLFSLILKFLYSFISQDVCPPEKANILGLLH